MNYYLYKHILFLLFAYSLSSCVATQEEEQTKSPLNILLISVDDFNIPVSSLGVQAHTPNIDELMQTSTVFKRAYCAAPVCNPSRASLFTGLRPERTGLYMNHYFYDDKPNKRTGNFREREGADTLVTLPQLLQKNDYQTVAAGKLFHYPRGTKEEPHPHSDPISWDYQLKVEVGTPWPKGYQDEKGRALWLNGDTTFAGKRLNKYLIGNSLWGPIEEPKEECGDWKTAEFGAEFLQKEHEKPFLLGLGIFRPHAPQFAPKEYFDKYPLEKIKLPPTLANDMDDVPAIAQSNFSTPFTKRLLQDTLEWKRAVQGYLAASSFADDCVGKILEAFNNSKYKDNTVLVFFSDHGYQHGEKFRWEKATLWNQATQMPLLIKLPNQTQKREVEETVSLLDIYPTVLELLNLEQPYQLDGHSLNPLLENEKADWSHKAVVTWREGNHSIHWKNWNYIHYSDGSGELYDLSQDPHEWKNLVQDAAHQELITELKKAIPKVVQPDWNEPLYKVYQNY